MGDAARCGAARRVPLDRGETLEFIGVGDAARCGAARRVPLVRGETLVRGDIGRVIKKHRRHLIFSTFHNSHFQIVSRFYFQIQSLSDFRFPIYVLRFTFHVFTMLPSTYILYPRKSLWIIDHLPLQYSLRSRRYIRRRLGSWKNTFRWATPRSFGSWGAVGDRKRGRGRAAFLWFVGSRGRS